MRFTQHVSYILGAAVWASYGLSTACAPVKFSAVPVDQTTAVTCASLGTGCVTTGNGKTQSYDYTVTIAPAAADILFVVDNSASMSSIQHSISSRFSTFFNAIQPLDYHIAITTTDISGGSNGARAINQNGALQDGRLIVFGNGSQVLTSSAGSSTANYFQNAIQRNETFTCESYLSTHNCTASNGCTDYSTYCPSEDTRGIVAARLAVQRNEASFLRDGVNLSIVIISNADERAAGGRIPNYLQLTAADQPSSFVSTIKGAFPNKPLTVDSIIIQPNDNACLQAQTFSSTVFGWTGNYYQQLAGLSGGVQGSVCAGDYGQQMGQIAATITNQVSSVNLPCRPDLNQINVVFTPTSSAVAYQLGGSNNQQVQFAQALPANTKVEVKFTCTTN